ncbi:MAG TPA: sulfite exporter TauE/SafE family protein [Methylothermaceae bacterium]|nr:sulfite exporter TauE/SafE family protein [Methylothermaceae bacterium]
MDVWYIVTGAVVGFIIGLTGVGGGSLMTPILILGFKINPAIAVGTDLLYAALTKANGVFFHHRQRTIDWWIVLRLAIGSIPASLLTVLLIHKLRTLGYDYEHLMTRTLGMMLVLTAMVVFARQSILALLHHGLQRRDSIVSRLRRVRGGITVLSGLILGILVTLSSVGAGAIGTAILFLLYPYKRTVAIVGTDLAHAVPLTAIAGLGHWQLGSVDPLLLLGLLSGGLPSIYLGSLIGKFIPDRMLRPLVAIILLILGLRFSLNGALV